MHQARKKIPGVTTETVATARHSRRDLAQVALLKGAHQERIMPLLGGCPVLLLDAGEVLLQAGDTCEAVYLMLNGRLRMQDPTGRAPDVLVDAGDTIGELALFQTAVIARTVSAIEPSRVVVIDRQTAWKLVSVSHHISRNWLALLASRSRVSAVIDGAEELQTIHGGHPTLDESTGLHNRRWLESMLPRQMNRSATARAPLALLLIEIDRLDDVVKSAGPSAGERTRRVVAQALVEAVRPTDLVVSYGPAQFVVVLPDSEASNALQVGERLRHAVRTATTNADPEVAQATVSIGIAQFQPEATMSAFLRAAEATLRAVKVAGGDRVGIEAADI